MPRIDPAEYAALPLRAFELVGGFPLHDVWLVELAGAGDCSIPALRSLIVQGRPRRINPLVRALFAVRSGLGRLFRLDSSRRQQHDDAPLPAVPAPLAEESLVPPGTPEAAFRTLYLFPAEAAYHVRNATVEAILVVAVVPSATGHRFFWATYVKSVGRITPCYMRVIDPFRRNIVYPGLETWLKRAWADARVDDPPARPPVRAPGGSR